VVIGCSQWASASGWDLMCDDAFADAVRILRQRMAAGAPLSIAEMVEADDAAVVTTTSTTALTTTSQATGPVDNLPNKARSDWTKMKDLAIKTRDNSHKWLEVGRSIRSGETEVRLSGLLGTTTTREDEVSAAWANGVRYVDRSTRTDIRSNTRLQIHRSNIFV
jgi:hypothetical protein